jgi:hypothetical protein
MDAFADGMIARGPTLAADRETWTGSVHIVDLPSADAAREFVEREPYNRAGLYEEHLVRRFNNLLGRSMWEFTGGSAVPRFMVLTAQAPTAPLPDLIVHGELLTPGEARAAGFVLALHAPTRDAVGALLGLDDSEIFDWEFGGRR